MYVHEEHYVALMRNGCGSQKEHCLMNMWMPAFKQYPTVLGVLKSEHVSGICFTTHLSSYSAYLKWKKIELHEQVGYF